MQALEHIDDMSEIELSEMFEQLYGALDYVSGEVDVKPEWIDSYR